MDTSHEIHDKIPDTLREQQQHLRQKESEGCITTLKDLNVPETKKLSSVLHGRKASTYLRIFRDDECLADNNNDVDSNNGGSVTCADKITRSEATPKSVPEGLQVSDKKNNPDTLSSSLSSFILSNHEEPGKSASNRRFLEVLFHNRLTITL